MTDLCTPEIACTQEVRFAVVMYGGVSLAIYINGIAQELFHLVRSTAKDASGDRALLYDASTGPCETGNGQPLPLAGTERVYRKLSYLLSNQDLLNKYRTFLETEPPRKSNGEAVKETTDADENDIRATLDQMLTGNKATIETRFVVDIMSGTSAGGINAIYLAKALANDQPIDQLKNLWLNEGDIALLINDKNSMAGLNLEIQRPPQSLLNSRRMYSKLLNSFDDMEAKKASKPEFVSPYVEELDLFVTATDLEGLTVPIRLSDSVVYEKRHRHVFHFKYSTLEVGKDKSEKPETATDPMALARDITVDEPLVLKGQEGEKDQQNRGLMRILRGLMKSLQGTQEKTADDNSLPNPRNDFLGNNNPFLAFAARCTSSFPFAFEPMKLCDIDPVLETVSGYQRNEEFEEHRKTWPSFFKENLDPDTKRKKIAYGERAFGDGGYLDNKPFSYASETIMRREAPVPVDRKLIYIEPSPQHPEDEPDKPVNFNALKNVKAALLDLPTYETIREDLEKLIQRNSLITRVNRITAAIERDLDKSRFHRPMLKEGEWETFDLGDMVNRFGIYYLPYRRLRIAAATDELATVVAKIAGLDENSAHFLAIRVLIRAWREINYGDYHHHRADADLDDLAERITSALSSQTVEEKGEPSDEDKKLKIEILKQLRAWKQPAATVAPVSPETTDKKPGMTTNQFLIHFDFKYWLRRLTFLRGKLDQLYRLNRLLLKKKPGEELVLTSEQSAIVTRFGRLRYHPLKNYLELESDERAKLQTLLEYLKSELSDIYRTLRSEGRRIQSPPKKDPSASSPTFYQEIKDLKLDPARIAYLLGMPAGSKDEEQQFAKLNEDECVERAKNLLQKPKESTRATVYDEVLEKKLDQAAKSLKDEFSKAITDEKVPESTWARCRALFSTKYPCLCPQPPGAHADSVREYLWRYLSQFDDFDQVRFPILYGTDVGESDVVEIIRISPEDAPSLIAERSDTEKRRKLAGTALFHFGAFLDRTWRQNDIMWGRLDGAERLITALLSDTEHMGAQVDNSRVRTALIEEAHIAILLEEIPPANRSLLVKLMTDALTRASAGDELIDAVNKVVKDCKDDSPTNKHLQQVMTNNLRDEDLLDFMKSGYEVNRKLDSKSMLRALSRSTQVIGGVFESIANDHELDGKSLAWIARLGKIFWGLVEVAVPNSIINGLFIHWLKLLYLFEALLLIGGTLLMRPTIQQFGLYAFALTLATNLAVFFLHDEMQGKKRRFRILKILALVLGVSLFLVGLVAAVGLIGVQPIWRWMASLHDWFVKPSIWRRWSPAAVGLVLFVVAIRDDLKLWWGRSSRWLSNVFRRSNSG